MNKDKDFESIAIIGIGCRFPGANNPEAFWQLLGDGGDAITEVPPSRWDIKAFSDTDQINIRWGGFLEQVDQFDPQFFRIAPREVPQMDPQQRLLLEVTWEALEDAGQIPAHLAGTATGVFIGVSSFDYYELLLKNSAQFDTYTVTGNTNCIIPNRISYCFDFAGPSIAVDTACSSALVAVHLACESLRRGECSLALAGGVHIMLSPDVTLNLAKAGLIAADGRCRSFDAKANGYVRSEGAGVVVLKLLSQAQNDGDPIYAVIRGSAVNQDGRTNGLTAPNLQAQTALLRQAYQNAGISPGQVQYVEGQGTGTLLGDALELEALASVLSQERPENSPCRIGSVKTNIGHCEAASGIAGLIKVALSLKYGQIPPSLHFQQPNPYIQLDKLPLQVQQTLEPWSTDRPTISGVSAFGFGGTNAHVVLEAASERIAPPVTDDRPLHILTLSAKTETALRALALRYQEFLVNHPEVAIADVCFSANTGRTVFNHRLAVIAASTAQLAERLMAFGLGRESVGVVSGEVQSKKHPQIGFLFTGLTTESLALNRQLYDTQPIFRQMLDRCDQIAQPWLGKSLLDILYPPDGDNAFVDEIAYNSALFALQVALCELWKSWGIQPTAVMGTSLGEFAAGYVAGIFSLEDAIKLLISGNKYGKPKMSAGAMVSVLASEKRVADAIQPYADKVGIALFGGPQIVIGGEQQAVAAVTASFKAEGIKTIPWNTSYAYHSPLMKSLYAGFEQFRSEYTFSIPQIPVVSSITGKLATEAIATLEYWMSLMCEPVQFSKGMQTLQQHGVKIFVEIGTKPILLSMGIRCLPEKVGVWLPSLRSGQSHWQNLLSALAQLYVLGVPVDWLGYECHRLSQKLRLPTYPFERQRYWVESDLAQSPHRSVISTLLDRGDSAQIVQILSESEHFSPEQTQLLPKLLDALIQHHQATRFATLDHQSFSGNQTSNLNLPVSKIPIPKPQQQLEDYLKEQIARVLGIDLFQLDVQQPLNTIGLDSLMIVQLLNAIRKDLAVELSPETLFDGITIVELTEQLQTQLTFSTTQSQNSVQITVSKSTDALPLSFAQEPFWFLEQINPGSSCCHLPLTLYFSGELDTVALEGSLNELVRRQAALRTTFDIVDHRPIQIVHPTLNLSLPIVDWRSLSETEQQIKIPHFAQQEAREPFDLVKGPLLRTTLLKLREDQHILLVTIHHLICDGSSMAIFFRELATIYQAFSQNQPSPLPELPLQYADLTIWQHQWLQGELLATLQSSWQQILGTDLIVPELRTDRHRPTIPTFKGAVKSFQISKTLSAQLKALSQDEGCTLFMLLLGAFQLLLYHYTGQINFSIGTVVANRHHADLEALIGCLINFIPLPIDLSGNPSFRQLLHRVRKSTLAASTHQHLPFKHILEIVHCPQGEYVYKSPLSVVLILHNQVTLMNEKFSVSDNLKVRLEQRENNGSKRDITLHLLDGIQGISGNMEYDLDLFYDTTINQLVEDFLILLSRIVRNPDMQISELLVNNR